MTGKWRVCRSRRPDGSFYPNLTTWDTYDEEGKFKGHFESWDEAMEWATSLAAHVEWWLKRTTEKL